jgi:hypothetical protein
VFLEGNFEEGPEWRKPSRSFETARAERSGRGKAVLSGRSGPQALKGRRTSREAPIDGCSLRKEQQEVGRVQKMTSRERRSSRGECFGETREARLGKTAKTKSRD